MPEIVNTHIDSYVFRWVKGKPKYLLLQRRNRTNYGHLWQGVAGGIEKGETAVETVLRELNEETKLKPVRLFVVDYLSAFYRAYKDRIKLIPVFGIEVKSDKVVLSKEHEDYCWVNIKKAISLLSWNPQKDAILVLHKMITTDDERLKWSEVKL